MLVKSLHWFSANLKKCFLCHCLRPQHQSCSYFLPLCSPYHLHLQEISVTAWRISLKCRIFSVLSLLFHSFFFLFHPLLPDHLPPHCWHLLYFLLLLQFLMSSVAELPDIQ